MQRDILPIVEGTTVNTKYGMVKTDHILFIAAGAFHVSKPSDLIPELQGRFPIRVELEPLGREDFVRILTEPKSALVKQYVALLGTEGVDVAFTDDAVAEVASIAAEVNDRTENIGARRLHTVMERLLDEVSFDAPELAGRSVTIDAAYVRRMLADIVGDQDLVAIHPLAGRGQLCTACEITENSASHSRGRGLCHGLPASCPDSFLHRAASAAPLASSRSSSSCRRLREKRAAAAAVLERARPAARHERPP